MNGLENQNEKTIQQAEQYIRRVAPLIGHDNAKLVMEVISLAKKQEIEIQRLSGHPDYQTFLSDEKGYTKLMAENRELKNFKKTTEEIVGDVIYDLIYERIADK